jgi:Rrf2 family protein
MKLTTKSEYSILALVYMARNQKKGFIKIEDICEKYKISKKYLEQLFIVLKNSGYVKAKRGANGGYKLLKSSNKISLAEIIRLMDGALAPVESVSEYFFSNTPLEQEKKVIRILRDMRDYISKTMESVTLDKLV